MIKAQNKGKIDSTVRNLTRAQGGAAARMGAMAKRRGARPQRLALSSVSASAANTPRTRSAAAATKLWNTLPGECKYSVADSPHLKLLEVPYDDAAETDDDVAVSATPRTAGDGSPAPSATPPTPADLGHMSEMHHHAAGFGSTDSPAPPTPTSGGVPLPTPDARLRRRRAALAAGSFKDGAGALFSNTAHLDLELLSVPEPAEPSSAAAGAAEPISVILGMVACVCFGLLLQPYLVLAMPQLASPLVESSIPQATITVVAPPSSPPRELAPPPATRSTEQPAELRLATADSAVAVEGPGATAAPELPQAILEERAVVHAAAHEWSLREMSRLSAALSRTEEERDALREAATCTAQIEMIETVLSMEMAEHRARLTLQEQVGSIEAELDALSQSNEEGWCATHSTMLIDSRTAQLANPC